MSLSQKLSTTGYFIISINTAVSLINILFDKTIWANIL
jgi:hypothetical protein